MLAQDLMTTRVMSVRPDASVDQAIRIMLQGHFSALPVVDKEGSLVGIVSEADLLSRHELGTERVRPRWLQLFVSPGRLAGEYTQACGRKVEDVMTRDVVTAQQESTLKELVGLMNRHHVKQVPIVHGRLIGIVSRADLLRALQRALEGEGPVAWRDDDAIRRDILAEFERTRCIPVGAIDISVEAGAVNLSGSITDERERAAVRVAVENVPGVKAIHDHLAWIEPMSGMLLLSLEDQAAEEASTERAA